MKSALRTVCVMLALLGFAVMPAMAASQMDCCSTNGMQDANAQTALEADMAVELPCHNADDATQTTQKSNDAPCDNCKCEKLSQSKTVLPNAMPTRGKRMKEAAHPIPLIFHFDRTPRTLKRPPRIEA
tara:strand:+ start:216 stop:599 length:384 start_codon:yes stop_codon:yes gene_type:complete